MDAGDVNSSSEVFRHNNVNFIDIPLISHSSSVVCTGPFEGKLGERIYCTSENCMHRMPYFYPDYYDSKFFRKYTYLVLVQSAVFFL